jgi:hypothetical protein
MLVGEDAKAPAGHHDHRRSLVRGRAARDVKHDEPRIRHVRPARDAVLADVDLFGRIGRHPRLGHAVRPEGDLGGGRERSDQAGGDDKERPRRVHSSHSIMLR